MEEGDYTEDYSGYSIIHHRRQFASQKKTKETFCLSSSGDLKGRSMTIRRFIFLISKPVSSSISLFTASLRVSFFSINPPTSPHFPAEGTLFARLTRRILFPFTRRLSTTTCIRLFLFPFSKVQEIII